MCDSDVSSNSHAEAEAFSFIKKQQPLHMKFTFVHSFADQSLNVFINSFNYFNL